MKLKVLLVEDNVLYMSSNIQFIKVLAKKYQVELEITSFTHCGLELNRFIEENELELVLLDVEIGKNNGITLGRKILRYHPLASIIFITLYRKYLEKAFSVQPVGFLTKPYKISDLDSLFLRVIMTKAGKKIIEEENTKVVRFKQNRSDIELKENDIKYIRLVDRKLIVVTKTEEIFINSTLKDIEELLSAEFVKIARDTIVNKKEVIHIKKYEVTMSDKVALEVSHYRYSEVAQKLRTL